MGDGKANSLEDYLCELYEDCGFALEMADTSEDSEEEYYWTGHLHAYVYMISLITGQEIEDAYFEVIENFDLVTMADRVDEVFNEHD